MYKALVYGEVIVALTLNGLKDRVKKEICKYVLDTENMVCRFLYIKGKKQHMDFISFPAIFDQSNIKSIYVVPINYINNN